MARKEVGKLNVSIEGDHSKLSKVLKEAESKVKRTGKVIEKESKLDVFNSQMQKARGAFAVMEFALRGVTAGVNAYGEAIDQGATKTEALTQGLYSLASAIPVIGTALSAGKAISEKFLVPRIENIYGPARGRGVSARELRDAAFQRKFRQESEMITSQIQQKVFLANPNLEAKDRRGFVRDMQVIALEKKRDALGQMLTDRGEAMEKRFAPIMEKMTRAISKLKELPLFADPKQQKDLSKMISDPAAAIEQISRGAFSTAIGAFEIAGRPGEDVVQKSQLDELKQINRNTSDLAPTGIAF